MGPFSAAIFNQNDAVAGDNEAAVSVGDATAGKAGAALTNHGNAKAGDEGLAATQYKSTSEVGAGGFALCMESGSAISGVGGRSLVGPGGRAKAGADGILFLGYFNEQEGKYRYKVAYVGEHDIAADTFYRADAHGHIHAA